ncbi:MAG: flagellar motor protein MotB [Solirubrobacteraceae bacterium]|nr:flagellar motor protein MotB [Solirubrobacteraceae bacterium]
MSKKGKHAAHEEHPDERWLLTYADMITLLMALFIVMFSISNVNKGKFNELSKSLNSAFNGPPVMSGGEAIKETGAESGVTTPAAAPPRPSLQQAFAPQSSGQASSAKEEQEDLKQLESMINNEARKEGIASKVSTQVAEDGLTVRVKTDGLLFDPGSAAIKPQARPLIGGLAQLLRADGRHAVMVSGHTDSQPISGQYPSNWELSTARASAVVRLLVTDKVSPARLTATGRAFYDPIAANATVAGRAANRRVELFLPRSQAAGSLSTTAADTESTEKTESSGHAETSTADHAETSTSDHAETSGETSEATPDTSKFTPVESDEVPSDSETATSAAGH